MSKLFDHVLDLYNYDFYDDKEHEEFVRNVYNSSDQKNLSANTRIFIPKTQKGSTKDIINSLTYKVPVYYGYVKQDAFSWDKISNLLGYSSDDLVTNKQTVSNTRYLISGPVKIMPSKPALKIKEIIVSHIWGVNLESTHTADYYTLRQNENSWNFKKYYNRQIELFKLIINSSLYQMEIQKRNGVDIQMPLIGCGCFLKSLSVKDKECCLKNIVQALYTVVNEMPECINLRLCVFNPSEFPDWFISSLENLSSMISNFNLCQNSDKGNVMNYVPDPEITNRTSIVINAWDPISFIGNGGSKDISVDGMIVANAGKYNNHFRNTSFLHNPIFNKHLLNKSNWIFQ